MNASASESKAQRESSELELQHLQQVIAQEKEKRAAAQAAVSNAQLQIESLEASLQSLQQQVRRRSARVTRRSSLAAVVSFSGQRARSSGRGSQRRPHRCRVPTRRLVTAGDILRGKDSSTIRGPFCMVLH